MRSTIQTERGRAVAVSGTEGMAKTDDGSLDLVYADAPSRQQVLRLVPKRHDYGGVTPGQGKADIAISGQQAQFLIESYRAISIEFSGSLIKIDQILLRCLNSLRKRY